MGDALRTAVTDWAMILESSEARATYHQRLADFHRASAEEARRNLARAKDAS